jgi:hypothetical protein
VSVTLSHFVQDAGHRLDCSRETLTCLWFMLNAKWMFTRYCLSQVIVVDTASSMTDSHASLVTKVPEDNHTPIRTATIQRVDIPDMKSAVSPTLTHVSAVPTVDLTVDKQVCKFFHIRGCIGHVGALFYSKVAAWPWWLQSHVT